LGYLDLVFVIAQVFSGPLSAPVAWLRTWVKSCGICGGQSTGAGFLWVLRLPPPFIHFTDCSTVIIIYHRGLVQWANTWTQLHSIQIDMFGDFVYLRIMIFLLLEKISRFHVIKNGIIPQRPNKNSVSWNLICNYIFSCEIECVVCLYLICGAFQRWYVQWISISPAFTLL
jgi:hypothetical protein